MGENNRHKSCIKFRFKYFGFWSITKIPEKGKPLERVGRKATGLSLASMRDMVAGLPGENGTPRVLEFARLN